MEHNIPTMQLYLITSHPSDTFRLKVLLNLHHSQPRPAYPNTAHGKLKGPRPQSRPQRPRTQRLHSQCPFVAAKFFKALSNRPFINL